MSLPLKQRVNHIKEPPLAVGMLLYLQSIVLTLLRLDQGIYSQPLCVEDVSVNGQASFTPSSIRFYSPSPRDPDTINKSRSFSPLRH